MKEKHDPQIPAELIEKKIYLIRGQRVMIDSDLASLYGVSTRELIQAVKRNEERFPEDFMFELSAEEWRVFQKRFTTTALRETEQNQSLANLRSQFVIAKSQAIDNTVDLSSTHYSRRRTLPYCFTEQGVTMLSAVLRSSRAVAVSIEVVRTFVKLRQMLASNLELARRLSELEDKYDEQFKAVFDAIRELMAVPETKKKGRLGF